MPQTVRSFGYVINSNGFNCKPRGCLLLLLTSIFTLSITIIALPTKADNLPIQVGDCSDTIIKSVETRLMNTPGSGSAVSFENGGYQVDYDTVPAIEQSKPGDPVRICLVSIPRDCPKGDNRGRVYQTTNLRTHQSWTLGNSEHVCGGA